MSSFITKIVIFDLDGTIVHSGETVLSILNSMREGLGLKPIKFSLISEAINQGGESLMRVAFGDEVDLKDKLCLFRQNYLADSLANEKLYDGVLRYLKEIQDRGIKIALCSNKPALLINKVINYHDLKQFFDVIIDGDNFAMKKPSSLGLKKIISIFSIEPKNALFIGDSPQDMIASDDAEIRFLYHTGGYGDRSLMTNCKLKFSKYHQLLERFDEFH